MNWPVYITLTKLSTRDDAEYPQEDRFPSLSTVKQGYIVTGKRFLMASLILSITLSSVALPI